MSKNNMNFVNVVNIYIFLNSTQNEVCPQLINNKLSKCSSWKFLIVSGRCNDSSALLKY